MSHKRRVSRQRGPETRSSISSNPKRRVLHALANALRVFAIPGIMFLEYVVFAHDHGEMGVHVISSAPHWLTNWVVLGAASALAIAVYVPPGNQVGAPGTASNFNPLKSSSDHGDERFSEDGKRPRRHRTPPVHQDAAGPVGHARLSVRVLFSSA